MEVVVHDDGRDTRDGSGTRSSGYLPVRSWCIMYMANVEVLGVLSNPSDGSRTRRDVEVVVLAVFGDGSRTRIDEVLNVLVCSRSSVRVVLPVGYLALAVQL